MNLYAPLHYLRDTKCTLEPIYALQKANTCGIYTQPAQLTGNKGMAFIFPIKVYHRAYFFLKKSSTGNFMQCHGNEQLLLPMTTQSLTVWNQSPVGELSWNQWVVILTVEMDIGENF